MPLFLFDIFFFYSSQGVDSSAHPCAEDKEEEATDSCIDCWPHSVEKTQCMSKKKKRKGKGLCNEQVGDKLKCFTGIIKTFKTLQQSKYPKMSTGTKG